MLVGDAFVRELEFSKLTLRLVDKENARDESNEHTVAKLSGDTFTTLQRILVRAFSSPLTQPYPKSANCCSTTRRNWLSARTTVK